MVAAAAEVLDCVSTVATAHGDISVSTNMSIREKPFHMKKP